MAPTAPRQGGRIRLACVSCNRTDCDMITRIPKGWIEVERVQSFRQSCQTYDDLEKQPPGFSVLQWWTHLGICPDCQAHAASISLAAFSILECLPILEVEAGCRTGTLMKQ